MGVICTGSEESAHVSCTVVTGRTSGGCTDSAGRGSVSYAATGGISGASTPTASAISARQAPSAERLPQLKVQSLLPMKLNGIATATAMA